MRNIYRWLGFLLVCLVFATSNTFAKNDKSTSDDEVVVEVITEAVDQSDQTKQPQNDEPKKKDEPIEEEVTSEEITDPAIEEPVVEAMAMMSMEIPELNAGADPSQTAVGGFETFLKGFQGKSDIDIFSGSLSYSYPVWVPKGRKGMNPDISLRYSSNSRTFESIVGYGWSFPTNGIFRTPQKGIDKTYSEDHFSADVFGSWEELVETDDANNVFAPRVEGSYNKYEWDNGSWTMKDKRGTTYTFGSTSSTRQDDPNDSSRVFKWMLDRVEDTNGNYMTFTYYKEDGQIYPSTIRYTNHGTTDGIYEVVFNRTTRPNYTSYQRAFKTVTKYLIDSIDIKTYHTGSAQLIRTYDFEYTTVNNAIQLLESITVTNGTNELPPVEFDYYDGTELNTGRTLNMMKKITHPHGGTQEFTYLPSTANRTSSGVAKNPIPFIVHTVHTITSKAHASDPAYTTTYEYEGGHYFYDAMDAYNREYAGFQLVTVTDPEDNVKKYYFHQSATAPDNDSSALLGEYEDHISKKGRMFREEAYDGSSNLYLVKINKWDKTTLSEVDPDKDRQFVFLDTSVEVTYDGDQDNKAKAIFYEYDSYGNTDKVTDYGEVTLTSNAGAFTDTGTDKTETTITYALNSSAHILGLSSQETLKDYSDTIIGQKRAFYDSQSLGSVTIGNVTKVESLIESPSTYIDVEATYNSYGLPTQIKDARDKATSFTYDTHNIFVATITNPLNQSITKTYNYLYGVEDTVTDPNGVKVQNIIDVFGRLDEVKTSTESDLNTLVTAKNYAYDYTSAPHKVTESILAQSKQVDKITFLDGFGREIQSKNDVDGSAYAVTSKEYDSRGNLYKNYILSASSTSAYETPSGETETFAYDPLNRMTSVVNSQLGTSTTTYDQWTKEVTDFEGNTKKFYFDAREQLVQVDEINGANTYDTTYDYDALGNLVKITDDLGNIKEMTYDLRGKRLTETLFHDPADTVSSKQFAYDNNGNLTSQTDLESNTITYTYDDLNRMLTEVGDVTITYTYDDDFVGNLDTVTVPNSVSKHYVYDDLGRVADEEKTIESTLYSTEFTYDILGNVLSVTYPDSTVITYTYNDVLQISDVDNSSNIIVDDVQYTVAGAIESFEYGNGNAVENEFDALHRLTGKELFDSSSNSIQDVDYTYDDVGNILTMNETYNSIAKNRTYTYDDLYRLTQAVEVIDGNSSTYSYTYNSIGNMLTNSEMGTYSYGTDANGFKHPHAVIGAGSTSYAYDDNGNMTTNGDWTYSWNDHNQMTSSTTTSDTVTYTYDEQGIRVKKHYTDGTTYETTLYINDFFDIEDTNRKRFVMLGNTKLATIEDDGEGYKTTFHHSDHLSSANVDADETGTVVEYTNYKPYGDKNEQEGTNNNDYKYTGKELDDETDLHYYEARYYNAKLGRFTAIDPWDGEISNPQTFNKYAYTLNNPIKYVDPNGKTIEYVERNIANSPYGAHGFIRITPDHPEDFGASESFTFALSATNDGWIFTGNLEARVNDESDLKASKDDIQNITPINLPDGIKDETEFINRLVDAFTRYDNENKDKYSPFSIIQPNSNNFADTILEFAGAGKTEFNGLRPGREYNPGAGDQVTSMSKAGIASHDARNTVIQQAIEGKTHQERDAEKQASIGYKSDSNN